MATIWTGLNGKWGNRKGREAEKAALETELAQPAVYRDGEKARSAKARLDRITLEAEGKSREWEAVAAELEKALAGGAR